jgi:NAD(P)H-dependent FMN reductase
LVELAPPPLKPTIVEIAHLPIYNQDADTNPLGEWIALRKRVKVADAVLFVTPEHNRSVPAAMKAAQVFSPGICWSGLRVNRSGSFVQALQMNS